MNILVLCELLSLSLTRVVPQQMTPQLNTGEKNNTDFRVIDIGPC